MPRKRFLAPEFFTHADLYDAELASGLPLRLAFAALWGHADRRGIFAWKPRELKLSCLPYDLVDFAHVLDALEADGFVQSYEVDGRRYGFIPSFARWQSFHRDERPSDAPAPPSHGADTVPAPCQHRADPVLTTRSHGSSTPTSITTTTSTTTASAASVASRRGAAREVVALAASPLPFTDPTHHAAADTYRRAHQYPAAFVASLEAMANGMQGPATPWPVLGAALVEMQSAGARFSPATLRAFVRRLQETPTKALTWDDLLTPTEALPHVA